MTRYLTLDEVLYMHQRTIERTGGSGGVRDLQLLEAALNRPKAVQGGVEVHPSLARKGAVLMYSLVLNHLFLDGNKRMGLQCLDVFMRLNGIHLKVEAADRYRFLVDVADETLSIEQMTQWIEEHSEKDEPGKPAAKAAAAPGSSRSGSRVPTRRLRITGLPEARPRDDEA